MKLLIADIGNTRAKIAVYDDGRMISPISSVSHEHAVEVAVNLCHENEIRFGMFASVAANEFEQIFVSQLSQEGVEMQKLTSQTPLPFEIAYDSPQTLGADRIAAVAGAVAEFPGTELLVIDAGTAVTYEYVSANGIYRGGNISPGLQMRFRALNAFTGKLPLSSLSDMDGDIGTTTLSAISAGVVRGFNYEVNGVIEDFVNGKTESDEKKCIILTGGDYKYLVIKVKSCIFARPNLVLDGIAKVASAMFGTQFE
ncbi:MAG: type III pantothenate kinase [Bacteroidales bacterium]|nr:type III pantothenate kinase [Bacteroidales bacterium]